MGPVGPALAKGLGADQGLAAAPEQFRLVTPAVAVAAVEAAAARLAAGAAGAVAAAV